MPGSRWRRAGDGWWNLGRLADGLKTEDLKGDAIRPFIEDMPSGFGTLHAVSHAAKLAKTPAFWGAGPPVPLGSHQPEWPGARLKIESVSSRFPHIERD